MAAAAAIPIIAEVGRYIGGWFKDRSERKHREQELKMAVKTATVQAKIERMKTAQEADIAWENTALENSGWKDEVMMIVILAPMVICFIPGGDVYVRAGFEALTETVPVWWQSAFGATVAVSYGLKKWADFKCFSKGV